MRVHALILFVVASAPLLPASAEWKRLSGGGKDYLVAVSAISGTELFIAGFNLDDSMGGFPLISPRVYWSQDGGSMLTPVTGSLAAMKMSTADCVTFHDRLTGWVSVGKKVFRTTDTGARWIGTDLPEAPSAIHFFDATSGIAVGSNGSISRTADSGKTWQAVASPTTVPLGCMFWLDKDRGFAAGNATKTETDFDGKETTTLAEGVVLFTPDGGTTWYSGHHTGGLSVCPMFFLPDGMTGWLATAEKQATAPGPAHLLRTLDGGMSFQDMNVPMDVGKVNMMGMTMPLLTSMIVTMHWADKNLGHFGGGVHLFDVSSGGGSPKPVYEVVDFITRDGGKNWQKTDLGTVKMDVGGGGGAQGSGQPLSGVMLSVWDGWMVGEGTGVWRYQFNCKGNVECGTGYECGADSMCHALPAGQDSCCGQDAVGGDGAVQPGTDAGGKSGGGCGAGAPPSMFLVLGFAFVSIVSRSFVSIGLDRWKYHGSICGETEDTLPRNL